MIRRIYWIQRIEEAWQSRSLVWLFGARRVGKTMLCQSLDEVEYFDCELPADRNLMSDPETFWEGLRGRRVVLDEVHRLPNPSETLKIATDHFPDVRVVATGSSTLQASAKFRDTLTGRKYQVWLTPMISEDLVDFGAADLNHRLQFGGLPPFFLSPEVPRKGFEEWMDSYWARDIQELFRVEKKVGFERLLELLLVQSGGMFEATSFTTPCELARATVVNYLGVLEETRIVHVIRPYATHRAAEIVSTPKVYGFDTAFVCHYRGWDTLRPEDLGYLWEHYVLNEIHGRSQRQDVRYWRDKDGHEIDFVLARPGRPPLAIECKWSVAGFETRNLRSFRRRYPEGENWIVCANVTRPFGRHDHDLMLEFMGIDELARRVQAP